MAALSSGLASKPFEASSTIGAENLAPPMEGNSPKKAGITASVNRRLENILERASTIPAKQPLFLNSISKQITK